MQDISHNYCSISTSVSSRSTPILFLCYKSCFKALVFVYQGNHNTFYGPLLLLSYGPLLLKQAYVCCFCCPFFQTLSKLLMACTFRFPFSVILSIIYSTLNTCDTYHKGRKVTVLFQTIPDIFCCQHNFTDTIKHDIIFNPLQGKMA